MERTTKQATRVVTFGQTSNPQVDVVDIAVQSFELVSKLEVRSDVMETRDRVQAESLTNGIEIAETVVATTLDIERTQVKSARTWGSEKEVTNTVDQLVVNLLGTLYGESTQDRLDAGCGQCGWREKRVLKSNIASSNGSAVRL